MAARRLMLAGLVSLCAMVLVLSVGSVSALAAVEEHPYLSSQSLLGNQFADGGACGVVTDSHGNIYVGDYNNGSKGKIEVFSSTGSKITEFKAPTISDDGPCSLAVDSTGDVYVEMYNSEVVKYKPTAFPPVAGTTYALEESAGTSGVIVKTSGHAHAIAVDPANQDLYVAEASHVSSFEPNGKLISEKIGEGLVSDPNYYGLDVYGSNGDVYVTDTNDARAYILNPEGNAILKEIDGAGSPTGVFGAGLTVPNLAVDQSDGDVYVFVGGSNAEVVYEFNSSGGYLSAIGPEFGSSLHLQEVNPSDVAVDNGSSNEGDVYVTSKDGTAGDNVYAFGPATHHILGVKKAGTGTGTVTSEPSGIDCGGTCEALFETGKKVTLTEKAETGTFAGWSGGGCSGTATTCEVTMTGVQFVTATFEPAAVKKYPLTVTVTPLGGGTVECNTGGGPGPCAAEYTAGETVKLTETPTLGYTFEGWSGACLGVGMCEVTMSEAKSVTAKFNAIPEQYTLSITITPPGSGTVECSTGGSPGPCAAEYTEGEVVKLTETPGSNYTFEGWSEGCSGTTTCEVTMIGPKSVTATYKAIPKKYALTIIVTPPGGGAVQCNTGSGPGSCPPELIEGETVTLTATPNSGYTFEGWSGACSGTGTCEVAMTEAKSVTATFKAIPEKYTLTVNVAPTGDGTVQCNAGSGAGTCASEYTEGETVTLTQSPSAGYTFTGWSGACYGTGTCEVTMTEAKSVTATYEAEVILPTVTYKTCATAGKEKVEWTETTGAPGHEKTKSKSKEVYTGAYANKECTTPDSTDSYRDKGLNPGPEGKYELEAVKLPYHFAGKNGKTGADGTVDKTTLLTAYNGEGHVVETVTCGKLATTGEITGEMEASETMTLSKCELPSESVTTGPAGKEKTKAYKVPCTSGTETAGTIVTGALLGTLADVEGKVYERLTGEAEPFAQFTCQSSVGSPTTFAMSGSALGAIESVAGEVGPLGAGAKAEVLTFSAAEHGLSVEVNKTSYTAGLESTETQKAFEVLKGELKGQLLYVEES